MSCERGVALRLLWSLPCDRQVQYSALVSDLPGVSNYDTLAHPCSISARLTTLSHTFFQPCSPTNALRIHKKKTTFLLRHCHRMNNWGKVMTCNVSAAQEYALCDIGNKAGFHWANETWKCSIELRISLFPFTVVSSIKVSHLKNEKNKIKKSNLKLWSKCVVSAR